MRTYVGRCAGIFAALCIAAQAKGAVVPPPDQKTVTLAEKIETVRGLISPQHLSVAPSLTVAQWYNWGNWRNMFNPYCFRGYWRNC